MLGGLGVADDQSWHDTHYLETHSAIRVAARQLRQDGQRLTKKAVAKLAGVNPKTIDRHYANPAAALRLTVDDEPMLRYLELVRARPASEDPLRALLLAGIEHCAERKDDEVVVELATALLTRENFLVALDGFQREWQSALVTAVTERAGREEPEPSDHMAVQVTITASLAVLRTWAESGFDGRMVDIWRAVAKSWGVPLDDEKNASSDTSLSGESERCDATEFVGEKGGQLNSDSDALESRVDALEMALKLLSDRLATVELPVETAWREDHERWHAEHAQLHTDHNDWCQTLVTHQRAAGRALTEIQLEDEEEEGEEVS